MLVIRLQVHWDQVIPDRCVLIFPEKCMHTSLFAPGGLEKVNMHGIALFLAFLDDDFYVSISSCIFERNMEMYISYVHVLGVEQHKSQ